MAESTGPPRPARIGPYEILEVLDSGGMGVVYRARDPRLSRDVALKVIRRSSEDDPRWRQRFADEARAAAALNHPNILAVYDVGIDIDSPYIVAELIDGGSLRQELKRGAIRLPRLLDLATQIADGLTAAHQAQLVHRDVKPENVMLTKNGRAKIVDFGLAKAVGPSGEGGATMTVTAPHTIVGTPAYMSPEQARGDAVDFRSDLFSFGAVLYEMVTGRLAFDRPSSIDTLSAILHDEPRPLSELAQNVPADLQRIIQRCLAKAPEDRYGSTADLLHDLRWLRNHPTQAPIAEPADGGHRSRLRRFLPGFVAAVLAVGAFVLGWTLKNPAVVPSVTSEFPTWVPLTFDEGQVSSARFGPDGQTIFYSAALSGSLYRVYSTTTLRPESRALELPPAGLLAVSRSGQLAVSLSCTFEPSTGRCSGTLGQAPLLGGAPRSIAENVPAADWGPGDRLAAIVGNRVEYPIGTVVAERGAHVRISPDGQRLAWTERGQNGLALIVREGETNQVLSEGWEFLRGLAWAVDSKALFVTGAHPASNPRQQDVLRIGLDGSVRPVLRGDGITRVLDAGTNNRLLVAKDVDSMRAWLMTTDSSQRRDLSWLGGGVVDALSDDGRMMLLTVRVGAVLVNAKNERLLYPIYVRPTDGGAPTFLGEGYGLALSPDGKSALTKTRTGRTGRDSSMVVYPLGPGAPRTLERGDLVVTSTQSASFVRPGLILFDAERADGSWQTFTQSIDGGPPTALSHEPGRVVSPIAPDGQRFVSLRKDGSLWLATIAPGPAIQLPFTLQPNQQFIRQWTEDGQRLFVLTVGGDRDVLMKVDLRTGRMTSHAEIAHEPAMRSFRASLRVSRDGRTIVYTDLRLSSSLFLVEGIK